MKLRFPHVLLALVVFTLNLNATERVATTPESLALEILTEFGETGLPKIIVTTTTDNPQAKGKVGFTLHPGSRSSCIPANTIYLVGDHELYQVAAKYRVYVTLLSAVILHESRHCNGADEVAAYSAEVEYIKRHLKDPRYLPVERQELENNLELVERQRDEEVAKMAAKLAASQQASR